MTSIHSLRPTLRKSFQVRNRFAQTLLALLATLPVAPAFANGVVHIPVPEGGLFSLTPNRDEGITFGTQYAITPSYDGLFYDAPSHEFNGEVSIIHGDNAVWLYPLDSTGEYTLCIDAGARALYFQAVSSWTDTTPSIQLDAGGIYFGSGTAPFDTDLMRAAAGVLQINGQTIVTQNNLTNYVTLTGSQTLTNKTIDAGQLSGSVTAAKGGTGQTSYTTGDLLYAGSASSLSKLPAAATGNALISGGTGTAPSWGKIGLTTHVSGTLPVANGGTGATSLTGILKGNGTGAVTTVTTPTGALVGTTDTQTLSNKTLASPTVSGSITGDTNGLVLNAGGTNKNVTLNPSGTGQVITEADLVAGTVNAPVIFTPNIAFNSMGDGTDYWNSIEYFPGNCLIISTQDTLLLAGGLGVNIFNPLLVSGNIKLGVDPGFEAAIETQAIDGEILGTIGGTNLILKPYGNGKVIVEGGAIINGPVSFANAPTVGGQALVTADTLTNYVTADSSQTITNKSIDASQLTGTLSPGVLPEEVTQLGAKVDLDDENEIAGNLDWNRVGSKPNTIAGYGITDALTVERDSETSYITTAIRIMPKGDIGMGEFGTP